MNETVPTDVSADWSDDADFEGLLDAAFRYAMALTHAVKEAEDLVHDACVAIVRPGGSWDKGYLLTTIRNRFIDKYRRILAALPAELEKDPVVRADATLVRALRKVSLEELCSVDLDLTRLNRPAVDNAVRRSRKMLETGGR